LIYGDPTVYDIDALDREPSILEEPSSSAPPAEVLERVEELWRDELERRAGRLFDGKIFSLTRREGIRLSGHFVSYRWWIAQYRQPELFAELGVQPLAVSGLLRVREGLVFGRRAEHTTEHPGLWELVPSGGIDETARRPGGKIAAQAQLLAELEEELCAPAESIRSVRPLALVGDRKTGVCDIAFEVALDLPFAALAASFAGHGSDEYSELRLVSSDELGTFVEQHSPGVVPSSIAILGIAGFSIECSAGGGGPQH